MHSIFWDVLILQIILKCSVVVGFVCFGFRPKISNIFQLTQRQELSKGHHTSPPSSRGAVLSAETFRGAQQVCSASPEAINAATSWHKGRFTATGLSGIQCMIRITATAGAANSVRDLFSFWVYSIRYFLLQYWRWSDNSHLSGKQKNLGETHVAEHH